MLVVGEQGGAADRAHGRALAAFDRDEQVDVAAVELFGDVFAEFGLPVAGNELGLERDVSGLAVDGADFYQVFVGADQALGLAVAGHGFQHISQRF